MVACCCSVRFDCENFYIGDDTPSAGVFGGQKRYRYIYIFVIIITYIYIPLAFGCLCKDVHAP